MTKSPLCPLCKKHMDPAYRPFCSKRCADVDLARWLRGDYLIEGQDDDSPQQEEGDDE